MTESTTPPSHRPGDGPEDVDRLLGTFFRGEVPTPWPTLRVPVVAPARGRATGSLSAGRWALAASVAALLAGGWLLSGRLPSLPVDAGSLDSGSATRPAELRPGTTQPTSPAGRPR